MIIEENASLRSMIRSVLELGHVEIAEAGSAAQALGLYGSYRPDWVLVDVDDPGSDGLVVTEQLKKLHPEVKVMLVTDLDSLTLRNRARQAGAGGILVKENLFRDLERSHFQLLENVRKDLKG